MELTSIFRTLREAHHREVIARIQGNGTEASHYCDIADHCSHRIEAALEGKSEREQRESARHIRLLSRWHRLQHAARLEPTPERLHAVEAFDQRHPDIVAIVERNSDPLQRAS